MEKQFLVVIGFEIVLTVTAETAEEAVEEANSQMDLEENIPEILTRRENRTIVEVIPVKPATTIILADHRWDDPDE